MDIFSLFATLAIVDTLVRPSEKGKEWFVCCKDVFVILQGRVFQTAFAL
jgi:hypothetical protein